MKRGSILFLQIVVILLGIGALTFLLVEPHFEGRNADATIFEIYFKDPFLAYAYIASITFFVALYQAFKLFGYMERNEIFTLRAVKALRIIKYCAVLAIGFIVGGLIWLMSIESDDRPPLFMFATIGIFISAVTATAAGVLGKLLHSAVVKKLENDLTV